MNRLDPLEVPLVGTSLIEASAGTGKTHTITTLYLRLLLERELVASEILVVTYTRAATAELRDRIRRRIASALLAFQTEDPGDDTILGSLLQRHAAPEDRRRAIGHLSRALADFDEAAILTIHGFCQRVLRENAFESLASFNVELLVDQSALMREIVGDFWSQRLEHESESFIRYLATRRVDVDAMLRLAERASGPAPVLVIPEPEESTPEALAHLEAEFQARRRSALDAWSQCETEVIRLLEGAATAGDLNKRTYKPEAIAGDWASALSRALADASPALLARSAVFERLTTDKLVQNTNKNKTTPEHPFFVLCDALAAADRALTEALEKRCLGFERDLIHTVERESARRKDRSGHQSYDDLLRQVASALEQPGAELLASRLRSEFRAALVDEFQDTDQLQYRILRRVWHSDEAKASDRTHPSTLFLIGDPKQAIYGFRGADVHAYLLAKRDAGKGCYTLDTNWRSDPSMVDGVNTLFGQSPEPFRMEGIPFESMSARPDARDHLVGSQRSDTAPAALEVLLFPNDGDKPIGRTWLQAELPSRVAADIAELMRSDVRIDDRAVEPRDIAVLCRTNPQTRQISEALRAIGIPTALLGNASVFDSQEAIEMERLLEAVAEPTAGHLVRAALATRIFGQSGEEIAALARDEEAWDRWLASFYRWHGVFSERGFIRMCHQLFREERVQSRMLAMEEGDRRLTNLLHLVELLEQAALANHFGLRGLADWLASLRTDPSLRENVIGEQGELRLESDADAVKIVTVHKSKGLEYPIVYCPYLWSGADLRSEEKSWVRFHDESRDHEIVLDLGSEQMADHLEIATRESLDESRRLLYVALTRAKHRCSVVWGNISGAEKSPLAALLHPSLAPDAPDPSESTSTTKKSATRSGFGKWSDRDLHADLALLSQKSRGAIGLRGLAEAPAARFEPDPQTEPYARSEVTRSISSTWCHSSFSKLASKDALNPHYVSRSGDEGFDYDAVPETAILPTVAPGTADVPLNAFPAGAVAGTLLHAILERLDFERPAREQARDIVGATLDARGFEAQWREPLCDALDRIMRTPWAEGGPSLSELPRSKRLDELEFTLPVAGFDRHAVQERAMTVADLAGVFDRHASDDFKRRYAARLAELRFEPLAGYLRGYVDLVFEWQGRFYIVDYKSNHLGPSPANYVGLGLEPPMFEHHYVLQYHLYTAALDRYLALRLPDYDYDRDFGGVYYLFLRGIDPAHPLGCGVYFDRPTRECIEDLVETLREPRGVSA